MQDNLYKSHEDGYKNVWLELSSGETLKVLGDSYKGYTIGRSGMVGTRHPNKDKYRWTISIPTRNAGVYFPKRKDAENYALILALKFNGDLQNDNLLNPKFFNGRFLQNFDKSKKLNELFWCNITKIDPTEGWNFFDFASIECIPNDISECYLIDEETFDPIDDRFAQLSGFLEEFTIYLEEKIFSDELQKPIHILMAKFISENDYDFLSEDLRGYATLCLVAHYRNCIPFEWIFPDQESYLSDLIPKLKANLPQFILEHISLLNEKGRFILLSDYEKS